MKQLLRKIGKFLLYVTYPILIVALIIVGTLLVLKAREVDSLNNTFAEATRELNDENQDRQLTIDNLKSQFQELTTKVASLNIENAALKSTVQQMQKDGYGTVTGKIFPVVTTAGSSFSQYQRVCAELISNKNIQTCRTVSAIQQTYSLTLPVGAYHVYAEVYPQPAAGQTLAGLKAYYTEYIKCAQGGETANCDAQKRDAIAVEVKAGATTGNIDPIDWKL